MKEIATKLKEFANYFNNKFAWFFTNGNKQIEREEMLNTHKNTIRRDVV